MSFCPELEVKSKRRVVMFNKMKIVLKTANDAEINEENKPCTRTSRMQSFGGTILISLINSFVEQCYYKITRYITFSRKPKFYDY